MIAERLDNLNHHLINPPGAEKGSRGFMLALALVLFVVGATHWAAFFDFGRANLIDHDWPLQRQYFSALKQGVEQVRIPYHTATPFHGVHRFLAVPEVAVTPQVFLLKWLPVPQFILCNILLLYAVGFAGCLMIARRYGLSPLAFAFLFLLFNFNGHITAHLGVGHPWFGYFLLPFFLLFVMAMMEGRKDRAQAVKIGITLWLILLQGSFHITAWCLIFLALVAVCCRPERGCALQAILWTGLLSVFRLAPGALQFHDKKHLFTSGYRSVWDLFEALVAIKEPSTFKIGGILGRNGWWEYDLYVGVLALAVLVYLGVVVRFQKSWELKERTVRRLDAPMLLMTILSLSYFYCPFTLLPIPLMNAERAPSRFLLIPFLFLLLIACVRMDEGLRRLAKWGPWKWLAVAALAQVGFSLFNHSVRWSVMLAERHAAPYAHSCVRLLRQADPLYTGVVLWSAVFSALALLAAVGVLIWARAPRKDVQIGDAHAR